MNRLAQIDFDRIYGNDDIGGGTLRVDSSLTIGEIVQALIPYFYAVAGILLLLYLIFAGFQLMTSGGDTKKVQVAKSRLTAATIGFIIIFLSYWIIQILGISLEIQPIQNIF